MKLADIALSAITGCKGKIQHSTLKTKVEGKVMSDKNEADSSPPDYEKAVFLPPEDNENGQSIHLEDHIHLTENPSQGSTRYAPIPTYDSDSYPDPRHLHQSEERENSNQQNDHVHQKPENQYSSPRKINLDNWWGPYGETASASYEPINQPYQTFTPIDPENDQQKLSTMQQGLPLHQIIDQPACSKNVTFNQNPKQPFAVISQDLQSYRNDFENSWDSTTYEDYPETYLTLSWFVCLCCCWPLGIPAIAYSYKTETAITNRNIELANQYSQNAKGYAIAGLSIGVIIITISAILRFLSFY